MHDARMLSNALPEARRADLSLAIQHHAAGRFDEAETLYQRLFAADPRDSEVIYLLGLLCCDLRLFEAARQFLQEALAIAPQFPEARRQLAVALNGLADENASAGKLAEAQSFLEQAQKILPGDAQALQGLARLALLRGVLGQGARARQMPDLPLLTQTYSNFGAACEQDWLLKNDKVNYSSSFLETGFYLKEITPEQGNSLRCFLDPALAAPFAATDALPDYLSSSLGDEIVNSLNQECIYYGRPPETALHALEAIVAGMAAELESQMGQCWSVVNTRAWNVRPGASIGPNAWHMDGFSHYVRKLMFYLNAPCPKNGTIEIATRNGAVVIVDVANPACILFDSAVLAHRGRPAPDKERPMIELTLIPALQTSTKCIWAGQNARVPLQIAGAEHIERRLRRSRYVAPTVGFANV